MADSVRLSPVTSLDPTLIWAGIAVAIAGAPAQEGAGYVALVDNAGTPVGPANPLQVTGVGGTTSNVSVMVDDATAVARKVGYAGGVEQFMPVNLQNSIPAGSNTIGAINNTFKEDANNTTTSALLAGGSFVGTATDLSLWGQVTLKLYATPSTAQGSLFFEFSDDGTNWDISVPIYVTDPTYFIPYPLIPVGRYFRTRYLNDGGVAAGGTGTPTNQTALRLATYLSSEPSKEISRTLGQTVLDDQPVTFTRAITTGKNPTGSYENFVKGGQLFDTTTPLAGGATYTSAVFSRTGYIGISLEVKSDQPSAFQGLVVNHWLDAAGTILNGQNFFNYGLTEVAVGGMFFTCAPKSAYFSISYTNGATAQANFLLECRLETVAVEHVRHLITDVLPNTEVITATKSVLSAQSTGLAPFIASSVVSANAATQLSLTLPGGTQIGDCMLAFVCVNAAVTITPPAGWTQVVSTTNGTNITQTSFTRFNQGEAGPYVFTWVGSANGNGGIDSFRNVNTTTPVSASTGQANASSTTVTAGSLTVTASQTVVALFAARNVTTTVLPPVGYAQASFNNPNLTVETAYELAAPAGSTGTVTATLGAAAVNLGQLIALNPVVSFPNLTGDQASGGLAAVIPASATVTGLLVNFQSALTNTVVQVKSGPGSLYGYNIFNPGTVTTYLQIYDAPSAFVTVGTTAPKMSIALPSTSSSPIGDDVNFVIPIDFTSGISIAATTTVTGGTAPVTALVSNVYYA